MEEIGLRICWFCHCINAC